LGTVQSTNLRRILFRTPSTLDYSEVVATVPTLAHIINTLANIQFNDLISSHGIYRVIKSIGPWARREGEKKERGKRGEFRVQQNVVVVIELSVDPKLAGRMVSSILHLFKPFYPINCRFTRHDTPTFAELRATQDETREREWFTRKAR
jgi:hypothetical protein